MAGEELKIETHSSIKKLKESISCSCKKVNQNWACLQNTLSLLKESMFFQLQDIIMQLVFFFAIFYWNAKIKAEHNGCHTFKVIQG